MELEGNRNQCNDNDGVTHVLSTKMTFCEFTSFGRATHDDDRRNLFCSLLY